MITSGPVDLEIHRSAIDNRCAHSLSTDAFHCLLICPFSSVSTDAVVQTVLA